MDDIRHLRPILLLSLLAGAWYLLTLAPSILYFDSPEFVNTAFALGVSHPAGFPFYNLAAKGMTLLPAGSIAFRVNLFSMFASVTALGLLTASGIVLLKILLPERSTGLVTWSVLVPVGFLAFSKPYWLQSIQAEVYTLHVAFTAGILLLLFLWKLRDDLRFLYGAGLIFGLSAGNHATVAFYLPAILVLFFCWCREHPWLHLSRCILLFLLGLSVYAYLPIRSFTEPSFDYGNPETVEGFFYQVTDRSHAQYHFRVLDFTDKNGMKQAEPPLSEQIASVVEKVASRTLSITTRLFKDITNHLSWICFFGIFAGGWICYQRSRPLFYFLLIITGGNIAFFYDWGRESLFPTYSVAALLTAVMLAHFLDAPWALDRRPPHDREKNADITEDAAEEEEEEEANEGALRWKPIAWALMVLLIPYTIVVNYNWVDLSNVYSGESFLKRNYLKLDNHSLYLPVNSWFNYYYHQDVERLRDDITAIPVWDLLTHNPPNMLTARRYPDLKLPDPARYDFVTFDNISAYNRELFGNNKDERPILLEQNSVYFTNAGLVSDFIPHKTLFVKYAPGISENEDDSGLIAWQDFSHILEQEVQRSMGEENRVQGVLNSNWGNTLKLMVQGTALYAHDTGRFELEAEALKMDFETFGLDTANLKWQWLENRLALQKNQEALDTLNYLQTKYPETYETQLALGRVSHVAKRPEQAIEHYIQASLLDPIALRPGLELATLYAEQGDAANTQKALNYARNRVANLRDQALYDKREKEIQQIREDRNSSDNIP
ncbi:MAG: DUF2723 domain-containing protein [Nitrospina sp.]|nr:DUF2723 domain-containing protein [Nitrospina sp.]